MKRFALLAQSTPQATFRKNTGATTRCKKRESGFLVGRNAAGQPPVPPGFTAFVPILRP